MIYKTDKHSFLYKIFQGCAQRGITDALVKKKIPNKYACVYYFHISIFIVRI